ncbi:MAG: putative SOS response-associated peptidase YedK [Patiriisocius sp.]|jgi:putative SOS response-associated peptidase YedK
MCYDIKTKLETMLKYARRYYDEQTILDLENKLAPYLDDPLHHASGFSHPRLLIYTGEHGNKPVLATWGLIPHWTKGKEQAKKFWNNTLNARGETIFEKPSFRDSARSKRCIVFLDGFYEHHHYKEGKYPFFISRKDKDPIALAGLWSEWVDKDTGEIILTFTIVTTEANTMLAKIHNNPKLAGPRMPVIIEDGEEEMWMINEGANIDSVRVRSLIKASDPDKLMAHTVQKLKGKAYLGNETEVSNEFIYEELVF